MNKCLMEWVHGQLHLGSVFFIGHVYDAQT